MEKKGETEKNKFIRQNQNEFPFVAFKRRSSAENVCNAANVWCMRHATTTKARTICWPRDMKCIARRELWLFEFSGSIDFLDLFKIVVTGAVFSSFRAKISCTALLNILNCTRQKGKTNGNKLHSI